MVSVQCVKNKVMKDRIKIGDEWYVKESTLSLHLNNRKNGEIGFEFDLIQCQDYENHNWVVSEKDNTGSWSEAECNICGLRKSNS
tara:strand:+ start:3250 stop:3504 length:255 start_codon:yes stop_codon:yes gene_type:complete